VFQGSMLTFFDLSRTIFEFSSITSSKDHFCQNLKARGLKLPILQNFAQGLIIQHFESLRTSNDILSFLLSFYSPGSGFWPFSNLVLVFVGFGFVFVHFSHIRTYTYTNTKTYILLAYLVSIWCIWSDFRSKKDVWKSTHQNPPD
jgi:hypothetical protein